MKIKTKKQFYFIFVIISLLIAGIAASIIKQNTFPYEFRLDEKTPRQGEKLFYNDHVVVYNDLDSDGASEEIRIGHSLAKTNTYIKVSNSKGSILKNIDLHSMTNMRWIMFDDYDEDNYKELFVLSLLADSLYLTILNVKTSKYIIQNQIILVGADSVKNNLSDFGVRPIGLINVNNDEAKEFVFFIRGTEIRTVYSYDLEDKKIINQFSIGARLFDGKIIDITNDGKKEIVLSAKPYGDVNKKTLYDNQTGWIFILDSTLTPRFTPKSFGSFGGGNHITHFTKNDSNYFYILYENKTDTSRVVKSLLLNSTGNELPHPVNFELGFNLPLRINEEGQDVIYIANENNKLFKLNNNLEIIKSTSISYRGIDFISEIVVGKRNKKVLLARGKEKIFLFDKELNLLSKYSLDNNFWRISYNFRKLNGGNKLHQIPILTQNDNYLFTIVKNKIHSFFPIVFLGIGLLSFLLLVGLFKVLSFILTYLKYFGFSLKQSKNGIVILNSDGNLLYSNTKIKELLKLESTFNKHKSYKNIFSTKKEIVEKISESISTKSNVNEIISYNLPDYVFNGEIIISPFISFIGFTYAYLIQIIDHTESITSDRMKTWSSTIQRIAHEIKTPLSGINLGLDTLNNRLQKESNNYSNDILLLQNEVERIKNLTKNFLLFSNMEKPNFIEIKLCNLLDESLVAFESYLNSGIELNISSTNHSVFGDYGQLIQLFHIVIENAIDGCGGKGRIEVRCEYQDMKLQKKEVKTETEKKIDLIKITIFDDGKGITDEELSKIFEPYYSTKKDGTGIGLAIAKKIVEDHKGKIEIESKLGEGTTVYIYLQTI